MRFNPDLGALLAYSHPIVTTVDVHYNGALLRANIPIVDGSVSFDDSATLKRSCELTVPAYMDGVRYDPGNDPMAPLNSYGQRLHIRSGVMLPTGKASLVDLGWYLIGSWERNEPDSTISVKGVDLGQLVTDDKITSPDSPPDGTSYFTEATRLLKGILPAVLDGDLADVAGLWTGTLWDKERADAIDAVCAAWPARWYVDDAGLARFARPYPAVTPTTPAALVVTDGVNGTITARARDNDRSRQVNMVVVDGVTFDDGTMPHAVASVTDPSSPLRISGPFGRRPRFYTSDLITTVEQAKAVAASLLITWAGFGRAEVIHCVPDPRVSLGDVVRVYTKDGDSYTGRVSKVDLPLTASGDDMVLTATTLPDDGGATTRIRVS